MPVLQLALKGIVGRLNAWLGKVDLLCVDSIEASRARVVVFNGHWQKCVEEIGEGRIKSRSELKNLCMITRNVPAKGHHGWQLLIGDQEAAMSE